MKKIREIIKKILGPKILHWIRRRRELQVARSYFEYSMLRCVEYSGAFARDTKEKALARLIMTYHIVEKGLTMPNRRFTFGQQILLDLIRQINDFKCKYGLGEPQVVHAIGVIKAYLEMHQVLEDTVKKDDPIFWETLQQFVSLYKDVKVAKQPHLTRNEFYAKKDAPFPEFAFARHTLRHYATTPLSTERIEAAVKIALSTPTACNRQYCRVHCILDKDLIAKLLEIQAGNRGFGHLADKLLVVTADLQGIQGIAERDDLFTNGGMFLMNLCYALYYHEIAHCILNWSRTPEADMEMRRIFNIPATETVIAMLTCGETPSEFDVASSPRRPITDILTWEK